MIVVVTGWFDVYDRNGIPTGKKEFTASHGIDDATGKTVILPAEHPSLLGAIYDEVLKEWIIL